MNRRDLPYDRESVRQREAERSFQRKEADDRYQITLDQQYDSLRNTVQASYNSYPLRTPQAADQLAASISDKLLAEYPLSPALTTSIRTIVRRLFDDAIIQDSPPWLPTKKTDPKAFHAGQAPTLQRLQLYAQLFSTSRIDERAQLATDFFAGILKYLPNTSAEGATTIPLIEIIRDPKGLMRSIFNIFNGKVIITQFFFLTNLQKHFDKNQFTFPDDTDISPFELASACFENTPILTLLMTPMPFSIPDETRFSGQWVIAPPGRGKTTLLHSMFLDDIKRNASIIVMDSKGDLINPIKGMAAIADRLVLIEPDSHHPLALNPLDVPAESIQHTIALIEYILSGLLEAKFTNLQSALFRHVLPAIMQAIQHPTLEDLKRVLANGLTPEQTAKLDNRLQQFFGDRNSGFYSKTYAETRNQIIWRLDFILTNDTIRAMFESPATRLRIADAMNSGKVIIIDASKAILGDDGSEFYQRFFLALILAAAQQRARLGQTDKLPVFVYLDECQWVRNDQKLATILDECRSQNIALILAHQRTEQITDKNVLSAMSNCAIRMANSDDEAKYLAPKLRCEPEFLYSLPRGTFAAFVRDLTPHAVALKVSYTDISTLPRMTDDQQAAIRERMQAQYGFMPQPSSSESSGHTPLHVPSPSTDESNPAAVSEQSPRPRSASDTPEAGSTW